MGPCVGYSAALDILWDIRLGKVLLDNFEIIVIHVWTNDLRFRSVGYIVKEMSSLIDGIHNTNKNAKLAVSAIIQRPNYMTSEVKRREVNVKLKKLAKAKGCKFLCTYRSFLNKDKRPNRDMFARDGLHLSTSGTKCLRRFMEGSLIRLQGKLKM